MRLKRVIKFRRKRHKKSRDIFIFAVLLPCSVVFIGRLLSDAVILPNLK